ncbi:hypothetical protein OBBRIDRAFT_827487 [Obba rivulosa]|uniref:Uncharacterized protein n=1 Tax=Obba rivulosa TaxID=1052685 RepID=A0A8E2AP66_9APHY|nr:hypothetical protein OBBRIDRAFT_827487 [Obba rivulosa]
MSHHVLVSSDSSYARRRKELLALIKQLRAIGAQADLDLPRIAVIGNQSAGKSSLVEAISGITVPRDAGTCTRCPMELRLSSSSDPWSCQISLRWEYGLNGRRNDEIKEVLFGDQLTDKSDVELALRRAQAAILNPDIPSAQFLSMSAEELRNNFTPEASSLLFSRNVVCIDLIGPELTDLSFIDLPGIIQNAEPEVVKLVEDLVRSHIKGHCLILVTLPMSDDIENQKAAQLARQEDPSGLRTIGVLTKPDTLPPGSTKMRELWLDVIEGRRHPLTHGYFCTRQPDDEERVAGITAAEARQSETDFFKNNSPWSTAVYKDRFGTGNLVKSLSKHLTRIIDDVLPALQSQVATQLAQCNAQLELLPEPITAEPSAYVLSLVSAFCNDVQAYIQGSSRAAALVQKNRQIYAAYKRSIRSTAPPFMPFLSAEEAISTTKGAFRGDYDRTDEEHDEDGLSEIDMSKCLYLRDIRRYIQRSVTRELPNNIPYPAKVELIRASQGTWLSKSRDCFEDVYKECIQTVMHLIDTRFSRYENLKTRMRLAVTDLIKERRDATLIFLSSLLQLETTPFTQNDHYLADGSAATLARYKAARAGKAPPERVKPVSAATMNTKVEDSITSSLGAQNISTSRNAFAAFIPPPSSTLLAPMPPTQPSTPTSAVTNSLPPKAAAATAVADSAQKSQQHATKPSIPPSQGEPATSKPFGIFGAPVQSAETQPAMKPSPFALSPSNVPSTANTTTFAFPKQAQVSGDAVSSIFAKGFSSTSPSPFAEQPQTGDTWRPQSPWVSAFTTSGTLGGNGFSQQKNEISNSKFKSSLQSAQSQETSQRATSSSVALSEDYEQRLSDALAALAALGYHGVTAEDLPKLRPSDEYEEELRVMAEVRAYFQVAYKRVIDYVPLAIDHMFLYALAEALQPFLIDKLGIGATNAAARCRAYLSEEPSVVALREELSGRKRRLEGVQMELFNFGL